MINSQKNKENPNMKTNFKKSVVYIYYNMDLRTEVRYN